jgi:lipoic acid synthetase
MGEDFIRKPNWLKTRLPHDGLYGRVRKTLKGYKLHTVCEEARCPNLGECWDSGTATFMILGDICTRGCRFCTVKSGDPGGKVDPSEPLKVAEAVRRLELKYVVITSVDRDDLPDGGASHFAETVKNIKKLNPETIIEVLIPDFNGKRESLEIIIKERPHVIAHNIETVRRLTPFVRDRRASYELSLHVLKQVKEVDPSIYTKSGLMLGLGEKKEEVKESFMDLRSAGVDFLTVGQYLQPSKKHLRVQKYWTPEEFIELREYAETLGFLFVFSAPLVRSSYKSGEYFIKEHLWAR